MRKALATDMVVAPAEQRRLGDPGAKGTVRSCPTAASSGRLAAVFEAGPRAHGGAVRGSTEPAPADQTQLIDAVVIADDSLLLREGIVSLLRRAGFDVVAEAGSGR